MKDTHKEHTGLPPKRLGQLSIVSVPGLSHVLEEEIKDRVRVSETFLPLWSEIGIRNQMVHNGYCAGFVAPTKPMNPLADDDITAELKSGAEPSDAVHVLGSYFWMKLVEIVPVVSKDELQAMSYKLICKAKAVDVQVGTEDGLPVPISVQALAECKGIATERLIKKAGVKINFYDIILDPANELLICNTSSSVSLNRLLDKMRYVLAGRFSGDGISSEYKGEVREVYELTHIVQGGVDPAAVENAVTPPILSEDMKEYSKMQDVWADLGLTPMEWPKNMTQLFNIAIPGIVLTQAFDTELESLIEEAQSMISKGKNKKVLSKLIEMYDAAADKVNELDILPVLRSINVSEAQGIGMKYPLGDMASGLFHTNNRKLLFDAVMFNTRFKSFEQFETAGSLINSTLAIKDVEGEVTIGQYDVVVKFHAKGQSIMKVTPGSSDREIIPLRPGINMADIVDRIENSILICRKLNDATVDLYRRMAGLYIIAAGIKLVVEHESGVK